MKVFVSWSGTRSAAVALALRNWLPSVIDGMDIFHSDDIPKERNWHTAIVDALRECRVGIFCVTPESLSSQWLHFEAGALAQHGDQPALLTYLYGLDAPTGPLSHFQATRFDRTDSLRFVRALAPLIGDADQGAIEARFEATWPSFEAVIAGTLVPIQQLLPGFPSLFDDEKTFNESFPDCSDKRWVDRLRRATRTHHYLEEERARSRNLVSGLQPLYYAAEAIDERPPAQMDTATKLRLLDECHTIEHFLGGHRDRDSGGQIRRRITSIRSKLTA